MAIAPAPTAPPTAARPQEVKIYSHSNLFYWWPVWVTGIVLAILTMTQGTMMVIVEGKNLAAEGKVVTEKVEGKERVVLKSDTVLAEEDKPHLIVTTRRAYGVIFATVLLLVIFITNVPLRGMWSVLIIMAIIMLSIIFALAGWWDKILGAIKLLDIRINMGGYLFISLGLLLLWLFAFFFFDRQVYITFVPGAMKVCLEIGAGEKQYDTMGMNIERERSDIFRHMILGLGSGDLIIRTSGADRHEFRLNNVLFINHKLAMIEEMQRVRQERTG